MKKLVLLAVIGLSTLAFSARAQTVGLSFGYHGVSVGVSAPVYYGPPAAPVYTAPPAYYAPSYYAPSYYAPPPVVYAPAPVYYPRVVVGGWWGPYHGWYGYHGYHGNGWHGGHGHH
jgi:hypothetical protein